MAEILTEIIGRKAGSSGRRQKTAALLLLLSLFMLLAVSAAEANQYNPHDSDY